jgi:hypothetical protein
VDLDRLTQTVVPTWVMVLVVSVLSVSLVIGVPLARMAGNRRGRRLAHPEAYTTRKERAKDTALFLAALMPSVLVWLAVMSVSFIGLTGFARDVMSWDHWTNIMVPLSLDGISISFGAWAFVAVKRGRHPGRAYKIVLAAATMSAVLNFVHGRDQWSLWAGLYMAFLSMVGMAMFHELLDQFMAAYDDETALKTRYPRFGQRWFYAPMSTFAARRAWIVHPPAEGYRPSVRNALDHLQAVRDAKRQRRLDGALLAREEQHAKLVEVQARNEVRRAKANGGRRPTMAPMQAALHQTGTQLNGGIASHAVPLQAVPPQLGVQQLPQRHSQPSQILQQQIPAQSAAAGKAGASSPEPVLDPAQRAELESIFPVSNGREPMGRHPLWDERKDETQRYIAESLAMGEVPTANQVRDWAQHQYGFRPSEAWARDQIRAVRNHNVLGMDADLV